jgi:hypothetical protein
MYFKNSCWATLPIQGPTAGGGSVDHIFIGTIAVLLCKMERRNKGLAAIYIFTKEALFVSETPLDDVTFQSRPLQTLDKYANDRYLNLSAKEQLMLPTQQRYVGRPIFRL